MVFKCEALLVIAIVQVAVPQTEKWARDISRGQLGDIAGRAVPEEAVNSRILKKAREIIG